MKYARSIFDSLNPSFLTIIPRLWQLTHCWNQPLLCEGNLLSNPKSSCPKDLTNCCCIFALKTYISKPLVPLKYQDMSDHCSFMENWRGKGLWGEGIITRAVWAKGALRSEFTGVTYMFHLPFCSWLSVFLCNWRVYTQWIDYAS